MHVMIIDDAGIGSRTLKEVLINEDLPTALLEEVGKEISARMTYSRIVSTLTSKHDYPALSNPLLDIPGERLATFSRLEETGSREIQSSTAADAMTHGDFWPGNVVEEWNAR
ncbi:hypothetical protein EDD15DRAFT_2198885 [Pisolithus albus]|nr:hypothetical protein EDD15DRAFT_2198885 [Pisolithus albus]